MNILSFQQCANCGACSNICPIDAISIKEDGLFYNPVVDLTKCIDCGACIRCCPVNNITESYTPIYAYSGWHQNEQIVSQSSSGGIFHGLAQYVIEKGGIVFGASFSENFYEVAFMSSEETDISQLRKSKYVESLVGDAFRKIKTELSRGRIVLFCGTPCQVAGLYAFLGARPERLITCDFACGGLPSHKIYQEYLRNLEKKYGDSVSLVDFRPKTHGWRRYAMLVKFKNRKTYNRLGIEDDYLKPFLYGQYTVREYCLSCKFSDHHASDITIADFWRNHELGGPNNPAGVSLVLCNTVCGKQVMDDAGKQFVFYSMPVDQASYNHKKTSSTRKKREEREGFLELYEKEGLDSACKYYFPTSLKKRCEIYLKRIFLKSGVNKK